MLKTLDVLIGLSVVMLLMSMIVTVITQFVTTMLNSRGKHLLQGLTDILRQIDPGMEPAAAQEIARTVLLHPLIQDVRGRMGSVIHREELTKLLLELAADAGPQQLQADAKAALQRALIETGACQPGTPEEIEKQIQGTIREIGAFAMDLELSHPELTNSARARIAILRKASSGFVAKMNLWFDQTMDRVADRFTQHARFVTFFAGLLLAVLIQLDIAALVSRLSSDDALREKLVARAQNMEQEQARNLELNPTEVQNVRDLMVNNVVGVPVSWSDWTHRWSRDNASMKVIGILLSAVLLSLGAPFWYNALQNLLRLRSLLAAKDDEQRRERQLAVPAARAIAATAKAAEERTAVQSHAREPIT